MQPTVYGCSVVEVISTVEQATLVLTTNRSKNQKVCSTLVSDNGFSKRSSAVLVRASLSSLVNQLSAHLMTMAIHATCRGNACQSRAASSKQLIMVSTQTPQQNESRCLQRSCHPCKIMAYRTKVGSPRPASPQHPTPSAVHSLARSGAAL